MSVSARDACISAFELTKPEQEYVARCTVADPDGACQSHGVSKYSAGPVDSTEKLARWVMSPPHISRVSPFDLNDGLFNDAFSIGASVTRIELQDSSRFAIAHEKGEQDAERRRKGDADYAPMPDRKYLGVVELSAAAIRAIELPSQKAVARVRVYDTANLDHLQHADIMVDHRDVNGNGKQDKAKRKEIRVALFDLARKGGLFASPFLSSEEVDGLKLGLDIIHA